jgi:hypothetical protein
MFSHHPLHMSRQPRKYMQNTKIDNKGEMRDSSQELVLFSSGISLLLIHLWDLSLKNGYRMEHVNWLFCAAFLLLAVVTSLAGVSGFYSNIISFLLVYLVLNNFRSDVIRFGTFDFFEDRKDAWLHPLIFSYLLGSLAGLAFNKVFKKTLSVQPKLLLVIPLLLIFASANAWWWTNHKPTSAWSVYAPTRHIFYLVFAIVSLGILVWKNVNGQKSAIPVRSF